MDACCSDFQSVETVLFMDFQKPKNSNSELKIAIIKKTMLVVLLSLLSKQLHEEIDDL